MILTNSRSRNCEIKILRLKQLYKAHYPMVLNLVLTNSGSEQEAKDVYQEAIIHFYERLQQAEFVLVCKIKTYLYAVSKRLWLKRLAEQKKQIRMEAEDSFAGIDQEIFDLRVRRKILKRWTRRFALWGSHAAQL